MTIFVVSARCGNRSRQSVIFTCPRAAANITRILDGSVNFLGEKWTVYPVEVFTEVSPNFSILGGCQAAFLL